MATRASQTASVKPARPEQPSVKILVPVWGQDYIRRFEGLGLASILSPGNLPALAASCNIEFIFLTSARDFGHFESLDLMSRLRKHAAVRYVAIDDLIVPGLYSVTLTVAYTRGMAIFGEGMTDIHFIYCNADFVLGDGALAHVGQCIAQGQNVVLAGSVRVVSEEVEPRLRRLVRDDGVLEVQPRPLARFVFQHPHIMQVAKTVNQDFCWARAPNHMFWDVDDTALVARFFQIFMLCLKPTQARTRIDGYCDYSFVPAFCPGEPIHVVGDSDQVCLLELQGREQEVGDVLFVGDREDLWARSIAEWCTPEHAQIAGQPILYHAADIPAAARDVVAQSDKYVDSMLSKIPAPAGYSGQYYWVYGVAAWRLRRTPEMTLAGWPSELDAELPVSALKHPSFDQDRRRRACAPLLQPRGLKARLQRLLIGSPPALTALHPQASGLKPLIARASQIQARLKADPGYKVLVVADLGGWIDRILTIDDPRVYRTELLIAATWRLQPDPAMDEVVILQQGTGPSELERAIKNSLGALKPGGRLTLLCHYPSHVAYDHDPSLGDLRAFAVAPLGDRRRDLYAIPNAHKAYAQGLMEAAAALGDERPSVRRGGIVPAAAAVIKRLSRPRFNEPLSHAAAILSGAAPASQPETLTPPFVGQG